MQNEVFVDLNAVLKVDESCVNYRKEMELIEMARNKTNVNDLPFDDLLHVSLYLNFNFQLF